VGFGGGIDPVHPGFGGGLSCLRFEGNVTDFGCDSSEELLIFFTLGGAAPGRLAGGAFPKVCIPCF